MQITTLIHLTCAPKYLSSSKSPRCIASLPLLTSEFTMKNVHSTVVGNISRLLASTILIYGQLLDRLPSPIMSFNLTVLRST